MSFLFVDRIVHMAPGKLIQGFKHVTWDDHYLIPDQSGKTIFPPSLIGETLGQLAAWNVMAQCDFKFRPVAGIVSSTRLFRQAHPGETLLLESTIDDLDETAVRYHSIASIGQEPVFMIEGAIGPLLPMDQFIDKALVRQQFAEIYRPGNWSELVESLPINNLHAFDSQSSGVLSHFSFDHCSNIEPGQYWIAQKLISRAAAYFSDHFPKKPVLPMTVLLQCIMKLAYHSIEEMSLEGHYVVDGLRKIKMNEFVHPGDVLITHLKLKNKTENELIFTALSEVEGKRVCIFEVIFKDKFI